MKSGSAASSSTPRSGRNPDDRTPDHVIQEYVDLIHEAGVEAHIVQSTHNRGTPLFPSSMLPPYPDHEGFPLPKFLAAAHEKGIIVLSYYAIMYNKPLRELHPEWMMEFIDIGRPAPENEGWPCFNSPHRDWLGDYLIDIMDHLDLDGFYFDDTNWGSHEGRPFYPSCICRYCEELFRKDSGRRIPRKVNFDDPDFRHFINWRYDKLLDFNRHVFKRVKEKHPDVILDFHYYARPTTDWVDGHQLNPLTFGDDGEHYFIETHRTVRETGFTAKVARSMGSPFCVWRNPVQILEQCTSAYAPYQEPHTPVIHGLQGIINGGCAVFGGFGGPIHLHKESMREVFSQMKKRVEFMGGETVKYVGLHYSQQSRDFRPTELPKNMALTESSYISQKDVNGTYEMLNRSHHLVDIVLDRQLTGEHLSAYPVLMLANSCLSDAQCDEIRQYVHQGGTLIVNHETSLRDEFGQARDNFALADLFGVDFAGHIGGEEPYGVVYVPHDTALKSACEQVICFASTETAVRLRQGSAAEVLCTRANLGPELPLDAFHPGSSFDSGEPAVVANSFGAGQVIYINSDVGGGFMQNPYLPLQRFVSHLVGRTRAPVEVDAPRPSRRPRPGAELGGTDGPPAQRSHPHRSHGHDGKGGRSQHPPLPARNNSGTRCPHPLQRLRGKIGAPSPRRGGSRGGRGPGHRGGAQGGAPRSGAGATGLKRLQRAEARPMAARGAGARARGDRLPAPPLNQPQPPGAAAWSRPDRKSC